MTGTRKTQTPASPRVRIAALTLGIAVLLCTAARAETVVIGDQVSVRPSDIARPERGMTMKTVEAKFGAPQERHPAVGKPPITRWDYPAFSVFFEYDHVIHAVVNPGS